jgi:hypothetical protein
MAVELRELTDADLDALALPLAPSPDVRRLTMP